MKKLYLTFSFSLFALLNLNCAGFFRPAVEVEPEFAGGETAMNEYITQNLRYPADAYRAGQEGTVLVQFYVEKDGKVSNIAIKQGVSPELDQEAASLVMNMPAWTPAKRGRYTVRTQMTLPVHFVIKR